MGKKAQSTIYIILGIVLLSLIMLTLFFRSELLEFVVKQQQATSLALPPQVKAIESFVRGCIENTAHDALFIIGQQGGYFNPPNLSTEDKIPYYFIKSRSYMPIKEKVEDEISSYINQELFFCTKNFVGFSDFDISQGEIKTETKILNNEVVIAVDYPLQITKSDSNFVIGEFDNIRVPVRIGIIYMAISEMIEEQLKDKEDICISCLAEIGRKNELVIEAFRYGTDSVIFIITDKNTTIGNQQYEFMFANQYMVKK